MSNPITRRFALFRIASVTGAAAVAAAPVAIAAIQPKSPESAELIHVRDELTAAVKQFSICEENRANAKRECDRLWPQVPEELYAPTYRGYQTERDCDDKPIDRAHSDKTFPYARDYFSAEIIREKLADLPVKDGTAGERHWRVYLKYLLPKATAYDDACAQALAATNYQETVSTWYAAEFAVHQLLKQMADIRSITPLGVSIKAEAYQSCAKLGKESQLQASMHLGPSIAGDVCRVLLEGDDRS